jgi:hypothetical protein
MKTGVCVVSRETTACSSIFCRGGKNSNCIIRFFSYLIMKQLFGISESFVSGIREGFMTAAADREAIRLEMGEGFRTATERHEKFKSKTEENNAKITRVISDVGTMTYQKIDANHSVFKI